MVPVQLPVDLVLEYKLLNLLIHVLSQSVHYSNGLDIKHVEIKVLPRHWSLIILVATQLEVLH